MKMKCFSVFDSKVGAYMQPFFMRSKGEALRSWAAVVNDGKSAMSTYPGDFNLFEIGDFDDDTGVFLSHDCKISLGTGIEFKNKPSEQLSLLKGVEGKEA